MGTAELIEKYDADVPRYTSYPTANHFSDAVGAEDYGRWLEALPAEAPVSLYLHVPFCQSLCRYCGCHTKVTRFYEPVSAYVAALEREIAAVAARLGGRRRVGHVHWGGGTPTMLQAEDMASILFKLRDAFIIGPEAEHAMEIDPRTMDEGRARDLARLGVNRASLGVQDFTPEVQIAVDRIQPYELVRDVVGWLRGAGIERINFDMIYGLPQQTEATMRRAIAQAAGLGPDRVAVFGYAHVPWFKKQQVILEHYHLPTIAERYRLAEVARETLVGHGYVPVGLDHYARSDDPLVRAAAEGTLRRNFQGYTTDTAAALLGFGASSISATPWGYAQNDPMIPGYQQKVAAGGLPITRGLALQPDDRFRAGLVERLMCFHRLDLGELDTTGLEGALGRLEDFERDGLIERDGTAIRVTEAGKPFTRVVCTAFDAYWHPTKGRHAKAV